MNRDDTERDEGEPSGFVHGDSEGKRGVSGAHTQGPEREPLFTDDDVRGELNAFYGRIDYPAERAAMMTAAFEKGLARDGRWAPVVLKDLGFEPVRAYRRVAPAKDQRA